MSPLPPLAVPAPVVLVPEREPGSASGPLCAPIELSDGPSRYGGDIPLERTGSFGYTVRVLPKNQLLSTPGELGLIASA